LEEDEEVQTNKYYCGCVSHYHEPCIEEWIKQHTGQCPICRRAFEVKRAVEIMESGDVIVEVVNPLHQPSVETEIPPDFLRYLAIQRRNAIAMYVLLILLMLSFIGVSISYIVQNLNI
jgi:hypothetical protein